jgi:hypothetical protein
MRSWWSASRARRSARSSSAVQAAAVAGVLAQPAGVDGPAPSTLGNQPQLAAHGSKHAVEAVCGVMRADDGRQPFPVVGQRGVDVATRRP